MLHKSRSLSGLTLNSSSSSFDSPWSTPVLGDKYRCSRSPKNPFLANLKKTTNFPKAPRPSRTKQIFQALKDGIRDFIQSTEEDVVRLKISENHVGYLSAAQHIKLAERFKKRLEFHLTKIEQLEENYLLHLQMWEGVKTMAKACVSISGKRSSLQSIDCGVKECIQTLCTVEASLESLLGTFDCTLRGLFGFARLMPGDVFEIVLRYGHQKWKSRGKIGVTNQSWDPSVRKFKALVGDVFNVKVTEVKMLGKHVGLGETSCEILNLFSAKPHDMVISLNPVSSLKLGILVKWNPLEGVDESMPLSDVSPRIRSSPGRREIPVRSMIEGDGQLEYWNRVAGANISESSDSKTNRYSVPCFPSSYNVLSGSDIMANSVSPISSSPPSSTKSEEVCLRQKQRLSKKSAAASDYERCEVQRCEVQRCEVQRCSVGALDRITECSTKLDEEEDLMTSEAVKAKWRNLQEAMRGSFGTSVSESLQNLKSKIECLKGRYEELNELEKEVCFIDHLLQKKNSRTRLKRSSSDVSVSIENALQAFSFLDSEDCLSEPDKQRGSYFVDRNFDFLDEQFAQSPESTVRTTDSGIESIANHLDEDDSRFESSVQTEAPSTGSWQVDVALNWHLQYCATLLSAIGKSEKSKEEDKSSFDKLQRQAVILCQLRNIARNADQEVDIHMVLNDLTSEDELKQFWLRCIQSHLLLTSTENFFKQLYQLENCVTSKYRVLAKTVFDIVLSSILDTDASSDAALFEFDIVTLHQFMDFFNQVKHPSVRSYVMDVAEKESLKEFESLKELDN